MRLSFKYMWQDAPKRAGTRRWQISHVIVCLGGCHWYVPLLYFLLNPCECGFWVSFFLISLLPIYRPLLRCVRAWASNCYSILNWVKPSLSNPLWNIQLLFWVVFCDLYYTNIIYYTLIGYLLREKIF